jgi:hypothetical protein
VAVGAQQVVGVPLDGRAGELAVVVPIRRNGMNVKQIAQSQVTGRRRWLSNHQEIETRIVEPLEKILAGAIRPKAKPQPGKAIARTRPLRIITRERLRQRALRIASFQARL